MAGESKQDQERFRLRLLLALVLCGRGCWLCPHGLVMADSGNFLTSSVCLSLFSWSMVPWEVLCGWLSSCLLLLNWFGLVLGNS